jgi:hypothetical protein
MDTDGEGSAARWPTLPHGFGCRPKSEDQMSLCSEVTNKDHSFLRRTAPSAVDAVDAVRNRHDFVMMATGLIWFRRDHMQPFPLLAPQTGDLHVFALRSSGILVN